LKFVPSKGAGGSLSEWTRPWPTGRLLRAEGDVGGAAGMWKLTIQSSGVKVSDLFEDIVLVFELRTARGEG
jgi:hypothetical protein